MDPNAIPSSNPGLPTSVGGVELNVIQNENVSSPTLTSATNANPPPMTTFTSNTGVGRRDKVPLVPFMEDETRPNQIT